MIIPFYNSDRLSEKKSSSKNKGGVFFPREKSIYEKLSKKQRGSIFSEGENPIMKN
jgi:hypothetical protein